jgi:hypothetical protein
MVEAISGALDWNFEKEVEEIGPQILPIRVMSFAWRL